MIAHIRGSFGTQVLSLMGWQGLAFEKGEMLEKVVINTKGTVLPSRIDYVSRIFPHCPPVEIYRGGRKIPLNRITARIILKHRAAILSSLGWDPHEPLPAPSRILHVRMGDRSPTAAKTYHKFINQAAAPYCVMGNAPNMMRALIEGTNSSVSSGDVFQDWRWIGGSEEVVGPVSMFTISAKVVSGYGVLQFLPQDGLVPVGGSENLKTLKWLTRFCPSIGWHHVN